MTIRVIRGIAYQMATLPPRTTLKKIRRRGGKILRRALIRQRARWSDTQVSDRALLKATAFPTTQALLKQMKDRQRPRFFLSSGPRQMRIEALRTAARESELLVIAAADQICDHQFDLLGSGPTHLGDTIDWHLDFKHNHRWPQRQFYTDIHSAPAPGGYDLKMPWELSRCQHFVWLGQAYWLTNDEKYAQEFVAQIDSWIEQNPPLLGVNWACAMDVALRAVSWLWGYYFFEHSQALTDAFRVRLIKSLLAHGRHIMNNLEWSETLTSNHYLSNIVGLVYLGILLPEFAEAKRWRDFGLQELENEMFKQVYRDGVDFEASISYHRLATELFLSPTLLALRNGHQFSNEYMTRLEKMIDFVLAITKPDGTAPHIGDNDNGRVHRLKVWREPEQEWVDYRYLLAIGAVLFGRTDFAVAAGDQWEEAIWLCGDEVMTHWRKLQALSDATVTVKSCSFPDAGIYVMRHDNHYLAADCGSNGQKGNGGHAHNDTLSFVLSVHGIDWLIDPGTYVYTSDHNARNLFRSSAYHNTVTVDAEEQSPFDQRSLFNMSADIHPVVNRWETTESYDFLDVSHGGYERLPEPVTHHRQLYFDRSETFWLIHDKIVGEGEHQLVWHWHFAPETDLEIIDNQIIARQRDEQMLQLSIRCAEQIAITLEDGWYSASYGKRVPAPFAHITLHSVAPTELTTILLPAQGGKSTDSGLLANDRIIHAQHKFESLL